MRKAILVICCLSTALHIFSQRPWSLRECIDFAIENNIEIKQQNIQVQNAEINLNTTKNSRLPDLNANLSEQYSIGRSGTSTSGEYVNSNTLNTRFDISSSTPVFTGFRIQNQTKADVFSLKSSMEGLEKAIQNLEIQITSYYLDILFKKEILKVYQEQVALTEKQITKTEILVENGKVALAQLYDIKAQLAKDQLNMTTANNDLNLSLLDLSQALNLKSSSNFDIEIPDLSAVAISKNAVSRLLTPEAVYQQALNIKPHVKEALYRLEGSKYALKVARAGYSPTLAFNIGYSNSFGHVYGNNFPNASFSEQLKNNYQTYAGLTLSIPIFNRFETRNQVRKSQLEIRNQEYNLMNVKLAMYKEIQQAYQNAVAAEAKYISTERAYEAALESFKYVEERYQVGKSTAFEYSEAQTKLITSRSEQIQAKYDYVFRSKILDFYQGIEIQL